MRNRTVRMTAVALATAFVMLGLNGAAQALGAQQGRGPNQWDQRYWNSLRKIDVEKVIRRLELNTNDFRRDLDRWLDYSKIDGTRREDEYNSRVRIFEEATNRLRAEFDRRDKWWETREQVRDVLEKAKPVAEMMRRSRPRYSRQIMTTWSNLRGKLNKLATTYRLPLIA
ncbi:MAG TPA: hypothetical protein VFB82_20770 [Blastocatellia bacterium]|nr:hypothetical protein [Blastocatellia bacterium]